MLTCLTSAILYRLDGWGKGDGFLPVKPFMYLRTGGINYARYFIGIVIAMACHNWWYAVSYGMAAAVPYGEDSVLDRVFGPLKWLVIGLIWGAASLNWGVALWTGVISVASKYLDIDHAWWEFGIMGFLGTLWTVFK